jgi:SAM-dependent methyltransferase
VTLATSERAAAAEAATVIIDRFPYSWAYFCTFRFALAVGQRVLMREIPLQSPSLEIGINDGLSASIAHFGKPKFTFGGDMPEESTFESMGLHRDPNLDAYEQVLGMDAHHIPFPDDSFNTIVTNDMLSYGLDRAQILREMVRVLAPGGTLFLTETSGNLTRYPYLLKELRRVVPTVDVLDDPVAFYRGQLEALGMTDIDGRTWFDHRLCALLLASFYRGEVSNPIDAGTRGYHEESLRAVAAMLGEELETPGDHGQGWQVAVTSRKPGVAAQLPTPRPICLSCRAQLTPTLHDCICPQCGTQYRSEFGNPYILSDYSKAYSPKDAYVPSARMEAVDAMLATLAARLPDRPARVVVVGVDKATRYAIRFLESRGIAVSAVYTANPHFVGHDIQAVPIRSIDRLAGPGEPVVISLFCPAEDAAALAASGYRGPLYQPDTAAGRWTARP